MSKIYAIDLEYKDHIQRRALGMRELSREKMNAAIQAATKAKPSYQIADKIALIKVQGVMEKFAFWGDEVSTVWIKREIQAAVIDKKVDSIMLVIDSPGGSIDGVAELGDAVFKARRVKQIVAQIDGMAASAGYWLASQASEINMHRLDQVGSVGVFLLVDDFSEYFKKEGVEILLFTTGDYKGAGIQGTKVTDKQKAHFQERVDIYFEAFLTAISQGRSVPIDSIKKIADGRMFIGETAVKNGLVDIIKTFEETFMALRAAQSSPARMAMKHNMRLVEARLALQLAESSIGINQAD